MRKLPVLGAVALLSLYGLVATAENHGGSDYSGGSVTTVRNMSSTRPFAPAGRGTTTVTRTKTVTYYGYPTATYPQYPTYPTATYPTATYPTTSYPSYTSMYYPTYYPTPGTTCYSCIYNGTNTSNPYGYSYGVPSSSYATYPSYPTVTYPPSYPTATYPPSYPAASYTYSTYPNYNSSYPAYSNSTYYYPGSAYSYTNLSYYPRGTSVGVTSPYGTGSGYFTPTSGSYSGPLGSFYYNRIPGYGGSAGFSTAWGTGGSAAWRRY